MATSSVLPATVDPALFAARLFEIMKQVEPAVAGMELYEFRYGLDNMVPPAGWESIPLDSKDQVERLVDSRSFYEGIQIKPRVDDRIVLDEPVWRLADMLFVGLVCGTYEPDWVRSHFYFDVRGFYFLHRTQYFTPAVLAHLGGKPFRQFERRQQAFDCIQDLGYKAFREANAEVDDCFFDCVRRLIAQHGTPVILAIAGPTAAGKTEIVERLRLSFQQSGRQTTSIEMDNFLTDRDYREQQGIFTRGKQALHFDLFRQSLRDITSGRHISIPRYDFVIATSSHDLSGRLKPGGIPVEADPADIIFIEGNFPFLIPEIADLIGIKVVYLTDDPIRLKRKWKRDMDYRKKYEPTYFRNRYFKEQFIMAEIAYRPQMEMCDLVVDTTGAALWASPEIAALLSRQGDIQP